MRLIRHLDRFFFILQLVLQQIFILFVRIRAKINNDRTHVEVTNPFSAILEQQQQTAFGGGNSALKNLASSFLKSSTTVMEYDMKQASAMQGGILFSMLLMWFLHFKMEQVQPLLISVVNGLVQLGFNPLFQVYVMGRNLERPFKSPQLIKPPGSGEATESTEEEQDQEDTLALKDTNIVEASEEETDEKIETAVVDADEDVNDEEDGNNNTEEDEE